MQLRDYQIDVISKAIPILLQRQVCYLALEMRLGKTITALTIASRLGDKVLFISKLKAFDTIQSDVDKLGLSIELCNYESLHKVNGYYDVVICDEAHMLGAFPKPSLRSEQVLKINRKYTILMSGTPMPESYSQIFHQLWVVNGFWPYSSFYKWAKDFVSIKEKKVSFNRTIKDYSDANLDKISLYIDPIMIKLTQEEAGFCDDNMVINEINIALPDSIKNIIKLLKKNKIVEGKAGVLLADTPVKMMSKIHQLESGTVILENSKVVTISKFKGDELYNRFKDKKAVVFYKYQQELDIINSYNVSLWRPLQFQSGATGLTLSDYDCIVYFNLDFSCTMWLQSRQRINYKDRKENNIYVLSTPFCKKIYDVLQKKEDYSLEVFKRDYARE